MSILSLSIIVPVYKVEQYLDQCVKSIQTQTFQDWELILVEDGSPDACPQICDNYAASECRIHVIHQRNGGLSAARNAGLEVAQGKYITFVDSDDEITPDTYQENILFMEQHPEVEVLLYPTIWNYGTPQAKSDKQLSIFFYGSKSIFLNSYNNYPINNSAWNKIYKRELFESFRYPVGRIYEDKFMMLQLIPHLHVLYLSNQGCYHYYIRENSILRTFNFKRAMDWVDSEIEVLRQMYQYEELQCEYLPRYMKTVRYLMNAKMQHSKGNILPQQKALASNKPRFCAFFSGKQSIKDQIWYLYISIFGMTYFIKLYLKLLKQNHSRVCIG